MKKLVAIFLTLALAVAAFAVPVFTSQPSVAPPEGVVYGLQIGSTIYGITHPSMILIQEGTENVVFAWNIKDAAAFACVGAGGASCAKDFYDLIKTGGNVVNFKDMLSLRDFLVNNGWKVVTAGQLPTGLRLILAGTAALSRLSVAPTILIVPAGILNYQPYQTWKG